MILPIAQYGNPVLRETGKVIQSITPEIIELSKNMIETMYQNTGMGLAAQQVSQILKMAIVQKTDSILSYVVNGKSQDHSKIKEFVLINPVVMPSYESPKISSQEGCLSFKKLDKTKISKSPDDSCILRFAQIAVNFTNLNNDICMLICSGTLARCIQHEYDHLHGILYIDRMNDSSVFQDELNDLEKKNLEYLSSKK